MARVAPAIILPPSVDPSSLPATKRVRPIFDSSPRRNAGLAALPDATPQMMNLAIALCVDFGMPRHLAEEARTNPYGPRHSVYMLSGLILDANAGSKTSRAALDRIREGIRNADAVGETLAAREQPADPGELSRLMGLEG